MTQLIVLSHFQARPLLAARPGAPATLPLSLDLNLSQAEVSLAHDHVLLPDGQRLPWDDVASICDHENACYVIQANTPRKIQFFSETLNRAYSLMPTAKAPTMLVAGFPMHRIKDVDPHEDTLNKIKSIQPLTGRVLDTTMGLGYTAIQAARTATEVVTIELDPTVVEVCRLNPWSQALFTSPNISRLIGDAYDVVATLDEGSFSRIIHDPPTFSLAGDLYAADFYAELWRVLTPRGRLFHYVGDPRSRSGSSVTRGVTRRLQEVGFRRVLPRPGAFGVVAYK